MKPINEFDPFRTGLVAIAVGLLMGLGIVGLSVSNFGTKTYSAELEHSAGLRVGEDVQVNGVPSGRVTKVELDEDVVIATKAGGAYGTGPFEGGAGRRGVLRR
jgi:phospholipid/cholesterol/gamma-HCH transport system substrate-binding protein